MTQTKDSTTGERVAAGTSPYSDENKGPISDLLNLLGGYQAVFNAISVAAKPNATGLGISPMTFAHHLLAHYAVAFPPTSRMAASSEVEPVAWQWRYGDKMEWHTAGEKPVWFDDEALNTRFRQRALYAHPAPTPPVAVPVSEETRGAWRAKAALLRSRGKKNTLHDIEQAADYLDAASGLAVPDKGAQGDQGDMVSRDPQNDQCGSQPEADVGAAAALATVKTEALVITVFHRSSGGGGSNSRFEHPTDHASTIAEAMHWLGVVAEAHACTDVVRARFERGVEQRQAFNARRDAGEGV
jgi:hypothetical protein